MSGKPGDQSPAQVARANRMRLAAEEGARAMEEATKEAIAVRKNMTRLRELRLAKEASAIRAQIAAENDPNAKTKKRSK
jgi:hypothetical protein|nr:transcriptional regulator [Bradyrhizobium sp.]